MKNDGFVFPSPRKYRCRRFQIGDTLCSWQLMWDCAREKYVCWRSVDDSFNDEARKRYEKNVYVRCPKMTAEQVSKVAEIFEVMGTKTENRRTILDLLMKDRWHKAAEMLCEKLAKADWEKYGEKEAR